LFQPTTQLSDLGGAAGSPSSVSTLCFALLGKPAVPPKNLAPNLGSYSRHVS
jgi:hypothetical protein